MRLCVGIIHETPGWQMLSSQEGISYSNVSGSIHPDEYSVVIAGNDLTSQQTEHIRAYLTEGGALLCTGDCYERLTGKSSKRSYVKYLYPSSQTVFSISDIIDVNTECRIPAGANELLTDHREPSVYAGTFGKGHVIVLPVDAGEFILDTRVATKSFYAQRSHLPFEQVSAVSKNGIRRLVSRSLELLHHKRGLPYVHRWYYPRDAQNIFSFRIDTDYGNRDEIRDLYKLLSDTHISASWFVDVQNQQQWLDEYASMKNQEIALHCYEHKKYKKYESAKNDIQKASNILKNASIHAKGFASPYGNWNAEIGRAIDEQHFDYSSEFSYDYDNMPSFPMVNGKRSETVQVPVHPVSIGSLRRQGFSETEMKEYFANVIERKMLMREPLSFYHHPKNHHEPVLEEMLKAIRKYGIQNITMEEYARWWKKRQSVQDSVTLNSSALGVETVNRTEDVWFHISKPDGTETLTAQSNNISFDSLTWKPVQQSAHFSEDMLRTRLFNPWIPLIRLQDKIHSVLHG